jgi:hypothetical protein
MSDDKSDRLSRETDLAIKIMSLLQNERNPSKGPAIKESIPAEDKTNGPAQRPVEPVAVVAELEPLTGVRIISRRDEIPISEKHVLVMWGLSTYRFEHPLGVTFAVDNSLSNNARDRQHREAQRDAMELARAQGLPFIYVLQ